MSILRSLLRGLGTGLFGLVVAAFLVGYAAPYLPPDPFWWTDLFAIVLPPLSVVVGVTGAALLGQGLFQREWGRVGLSTVLLILVIARFGPRLAAWGPTLPANDTLGIMTHNVPAHPRSRGGFPAEPLSSLVRREAPDILAFQESRFRTGPDRPGSVRRKTPAIEWALQEAGFPPPSWLPPETTIQQPVLGHYLDSTNVHTLSVGDPDQARSEYTRTSFTWRGRRAVLYNLHLHTVGAERPWTDPATPWTDPAAWRRFLRSYRESALRRAAQARQVHRALQREPVPVVVVGDFNSTPHQWAYQHIAQGLRNVLARRGRTWHATFPSHRPLVAIDHILVGPHWQVTEAKVPFSQGLSSVSDHRPVVTRLRWRAQDAANDDAN